MDWPITSSHNYFSCWRKFFQKGVHYPIKIISQRIYFVQWVWNIKRYMHALIIIFYIEKSLKSYNIEIVDYYDIRLGIIIKRIMRRRQRIVPLRRWLYLLKVKRLFGNYNHSTNLRWHTNERKCDELFHHLTDSLQWKNIVMNFLNLGMNQEI